MTSQTQTKKRTPGNLRDVPTFMVTIEDPRDPLNLVTLHLKGDWARQQLEYWAHTKKLKIHVIPVMVHTSFESIQGVISHVFDLESVKPDVFEYRDNRSLEPFDYTDNDSLKEFK